MSALKHIEGKTFRFGGYYLEHYALDGMFYVYLPEAGYGSAKVWTTVCASLRSAIGAIERHIAAQVRL